MFLIFTCSGFCLSPLPEKPSCWDDWNFDEKIAWRGQHLDPRIPYGPLVDKLEVKNIVGNSIITAKTLFATNNIQLISTKALPENYVMKANNASGRGLLIKNGMVLARKKRDVDFVPIQATNEVLRSHAKYWLEDLFARNIELQYGLITPMILFEEYLENLTMDIELFCFNGKVQLIEILFIDHYKKNPVISFYDPNWNLLKTSHPHHEVKNEKIDRPKWLDELIAFSEKFTQNIDHVRIDFYLNGDDIYFGEFTFTTGKGVIPKNFQQILGSYWPYPG